MSFFFKKMILAEIQYKTYDDEFLAIIEVFKTWQNFFEGYKYEILIFIYQNILYCFINTKSLSYKEKKP